MQKKLVRFRATCCFKALVAGEMGDGVLNWIPPWLDRPDQPVYMSNQNPRAPNKPAQCPRVPGFWGFACAASLPTLSLLNTGKYGRMGTQQP